jgi:hypothetical protein
MFTEYEDSREYNPNRASARRLDLLVAPHRA